MTPCRLHELNPHTTPTLVTNPGWSDITGTGAEDGTRAFVNASSAIIAVAVEGHQPIIRVRGVFEDDTATDWMAATFRPD